MTVITAVLWSLLALAGIVCLDIAASSDAALTAWAWGRLPSFAGLVVANAILAGLAKLTGAWRFNPDTSDDAPVYRPTIVGRGLALLSCAVMQRLAAHPIVENRIGGFDPAEVRRRLEHQRGEILGDYKWRDVPSKAPAGGEAR